MSMYNDLVITEKDQQEEDSINLKQLFYKYLSYWKWIVASFILFVLLGFLYTKITTPIYEVQSSVLIKKNDSGAGANDLMAQLNLFSGSKETDNEVEIFKSYTLMERVVEDLNLNVRYYKKEGLRKRELYKDSPIRVEIITPNDTLFQKPLKMKLTGENNIKINGETCPLNAPVRQFSGAFKVMLIDSVAKTWDKDEELTVALSNKKAMVKNMQEALSVTTPTKGNATVLYLNLQVPNRDMGIDILTKLIQKYNQANVEDKNTVAANTMAFIQERITLLSEELNNAEKDVERFKSANQITDISAQSQLFLQSVQSKDAQLSQVNIQLGVLGNIEQYVLNKNNEATSAPATLGIGDPTLLGLIAQLTSLETERAKALKTVRPDNPIVAAYDDQISNLKQSIYANIQTLKKGLEITRRSIQNENNQLESMIRSIPQKERELVDITRQQSIKNELYVFLLSKKEEVALSYAATVSDSRIIDYPISTDIPVKPVKRNILLIFGLLGLIIPVGVIYLKELIYNKVENKSDVHKETSIPIIGEISFLENNSAPIIISLKERNRQGEQFRSLRTNLQFLWKNDGNANIVLITSDTSGEGKSFVALNLGAGLALTGKKTVLLGFDMRHPQLQKRLNIKNSIGLSGYLSKQAELDDIIYSIPEYAGYFFIPGGPIPPNPIELMMGEKMPLLFEELGKRFDYIVIDSPPVGLVSDALILEKYTDITLYVVRHNYTTKESLKNIENLHKNDRFKKMNIVINGVKDDTLYYGYKYKNTYYD
ncbi:MAG: polysaccharide biosynthesis tyrosine autokinase [Candidatus Azobacteroides sp.]|nr:polysaccharide biosynthesis tyrosine autokinase [Candidatus Azobacteroides sp.]